MKQILFIAFCSFFMATTGCSQKLTVPPVVIKAFNNKYPNATDVKWGKESAKEYEAEFKYNDAKLAANFKSDGTWIVTESLIPVTELPAVLTEAINSKYPGSAITKAEKVEKPGEKIIYEILIKVNGKTKEVKLNADGSIVK